MEVCLNPKFSCLTKASLKDIINLAKISVYYMLGMQYQNAQAPDVVFP